jgi:cation transport ATPase
VVFDKTGTLTLENPVLENPEVLAALPPEARHRAAHARHRQPASGQPQPL